jgi:serine/threonine protein kinase
MDVISTPQGLRRFGPYVLLQLSGAGGMGRVDVALAARTGGMERLCVVKRMHAQLRTAEQDARFRREASIAIGLSHGAIAQTIDVETIEGELCILQEFIHGCNLAQLEHRAAAHEQLPVALSVHVVREVARALAYAHSFNATGIVHRDVTSDNIMLSFSGEVKLVDFGIAKPMGDKSLTQVGHLVGRPIYSAPEVLLGRDADQRSDLYSLGVVLWQLLTGGSFPDIFEKQVASAPSLINRAVSSELDDLCLKAVALQPEDRFQTAEQLLDALSALDGLASVHDRTVVRFLAQHFNVDDERRQLARDVERARALLDEPATEVAPPTTVAPVSALLSSPIPIATPPRTRALPLVMLAAGALAGASITYAVSTRHFRRAEPTVAMSPSLSAALQEGAPTRQIVAAADVPPAAPPVEVVPPEAAPVSAAKRHPSPRAVRRASGASAAPPVDSAALLQEAARSYKTGALDRALELARAAASAGAGAGAHLIIGKVLFLQDKLTAADAEFREAARLNPEDPEAGRYLRVLKLKISGNGEGEGHEN